MSGLYEDRDLVNGVLSLDRPLEPWDFIFLLWPVEVLFIIFGIISDLTAPTSSEMGSSVRPAGNAHKELNMKCSSCGGNNFNWASKCDHCGHSLKGHGATTQTGESRTEPPVGVVGSGTVSEVEKDTLTKDTSGIYGSELESLRARLRSNSGYLPCRRCQRSVRIDLDQIERDIRRRRQTAMESPFRAVVFSADLSKGLVCTQCREVFCGSCSVEMQELARQISPMYSAFCTHCQKVLAGIDHITD